VVLSCDATNPTLNQDSQLSSSELGVFLRKYSNHRGEFSLSQIRSQWNDSEKTKAEDVRLSGTSSLVVSGVAHVQLTAHAIATGRGGMLRPKTWRVEVEFSPFM